MPFWHPKRKIGDFPNLLLQIFFRKGQTVARLRFDGMKRRGKRTKSLVVRKSRQYNTSRSTMAMWKFKKIHACASHEQKYDRFNCNTVHTNIFFSCGVEVFFFGNFHTSPLSIAMYHAFFCFTRSRSIPLKKKKIYFVVR